MDLQVAGDVTGMWAESVANVSAGISGLGLDSTLRSVQTAAEIVGIMDGLMQGISVMTSLISMYRSRETAEAALQTAAAVLTGQGWKVAAAIGVAGVATAATYAVVSKVRNVRINGSNPGELDLTKSMMGA